MLIAILAAAATAATPPPGYTNPDWFKRPDSTEIEAAWPLRAHALGIGGKALMQCAVNTHGVLETCRILKESPTGMGFGAAALSLAQTFLMKPATGPRGPVASDVTIPIKFTPGHLPFKGTPRDLGETATMIPRPVWATAPRFADLGEAYPKQAGDVAGYVALRCELRDTGAVKDCDILREEPKGKGFGKTADNLAKRFRAAVDPALFKDRVPVWADLPIRFPSPRSLEFKNHHLGQPVWTAGVDPARVATLFPAQAAERGLRTGKGIAECTVAADGSLQNCHPVVGEPDDLGFSQSAVKVASVMRMNLWTQEGGPIDGATIRLPVVFNLAASAAASPPTSPR